MLCWTHTGLAPSVASPVKATGKICKEVAISPPPPLSSCPSPHTQFLLLSLISSQTGDGGTERMSAKAVLSNGQPTSLARDFTGSRLPSLPLLFCSRDHLFLNGLELKKKRKELLRFLESQMGRFASAWRDQVGFSGLCPVFPPLQASEPWPGERESEEPKEDLPVIFTPLKSNLHP